MPSHFCRFSSPSGNPVSIFTARKRSLRRLCFYRCVSVHGGGGGGHAWQGGMRGRRVCMVGVRAWWGVCMAGGMRGRGHAWWGVHDRGACVAGGRACHARPPPPARYYGYGIRSMSGRYASYWNAFLSQMISCNALLQT